MSSSQISVSGKVVVITGASMGIGEAIAKLFVDEGARVVLLSRDAGRAEAARGRIGHTENTLALSCDVRNREEIDRVVSLTLHHFQRIDVWINNAGHGLMDTAADVDMNALHETFDTNFFATVALTQKLLPHIRKASAGRIVNVSSILGSLTLHADPASPIYAFKVFAYDASKAALNAFTVHLAHELRDTKIKVNSAHPGWVKTDMGGPNATMEVSEGGKTSAQLATLPENGPNGGFYHLGQPVPW